MEFIKMKKRLADNFASALGNKPLFEVDVDKDKLWDLYLDSFPAGSNTIYRKRRKHDCSCCKSFIRAIGGAVYIDDNLEVHSIFEFDTGSDVYQPVMDALAAYVKSKEITSIFLYERNSVGVDTSRELLLDGSVYTYNHFYLNLPNQCVEKPKDIARIKDIRNTDAKIFNRSLSQITLEAIETVLDLITSNTLYKGEEWKTRLEAFKQAKIEYDAVAPEKRLTYSWLKSGMDFAPVARIRAHSIGVLLCDLSEGVDLESAVKRYEQIVAPTNYKRPKAIFTKKMLENAKATITELGYMESLPRRYATLDDITVNNILFSNKDASKRIAGDVFEDMMADIPVKKSSQIEELTIDDFVKNVLPTVNEVEVLVENRHAPNMMSLIAPVNKDAPSMFKWNNGFSWAYSGNITDSDIRDRVKNAGGNVDGVLRFSIQWNDTGTHDGNDLDAHCLEPNKNEIYFGAMRSPFTRGFLDVDHRYPAGIVPVVENIAWADMSRMIPGDYIFAVHQYANRGGRGGFRAEIEFDGQIYRYDYPKELRQGEIIRVATVHLSNTGTFTIKHDLSSEMSSREIWGVKTNTFVPVSVMMYSPNYWDDQTGIGHRHYFFMLKDCVNPENPNGFYNEFLKNDLLEHKRVFEALGGKMAVAPAEDQLSGLGFSATKRNDIIVKVKGTTERTIKIIF